MKIEGATALVTGANRGIGKAFAEELLARGASKVYAGVRDVSTVTDPRLVPVQLDVTVPERIAAVAAELTDVDLVVNNAGTGRPALPLAATLDDARFELELNYLSLISMTEAFAPVLAENGGGAIVNMLSVVSWLAAPNLSTYSASKAAAWSYTNSSRVQLKTAGHRGRRRPRRLRRHRPDRLLRRRQGPAAAGRDGRLRRTRGGRARGPGRRLDPPGQGGPQRRPEPDLPGRRGAVQGRDRRGRVTCPSRPGVSARRGRCSSTRRSSTPGRPWRR